MLVIMAGNFVAGIGPLRATMAVIAGDNASTLLATLGTQMATEHRRHPGHRDSQAQQ